MIPTRLSRATALILVIAASIACHREPPREAPDEVDSAGVRIVMVTDLEWALPHWRIEIESPLVVLSEQFSHLSSAVVFPDGRVVVAVDEEFRIHAFDPLGHIVAKFGRRGRGPEEFERVPKLFLYGDSLITVHERRGQLDIRVWNPSLELVRAWHSRVPGTYDSWSGAIGIAADGSILVMTSLTVPPTAPRRGPHRAEVTIHRATAIGGDAVPIMRLSGDERYGLDGDNGVGDTFVQFGKITAVTASNGLIRSGSNDGFQVDTWSADGRLVRSLRIMTRPRRITKEKRDQWEREELEDTPPDHRGLTELVHSARRYSDYLRFHDALYPVEGGGIWVELASLSNRDPRRVLIVDDSDRIVGDISLARDVRPYWIGPDQVLLQAEDTNHGPTIGLYRIVQ